MPRTKRDIALDSPSKRARLKVRTPPYWTWVAEGLSLGYRKNYLRGGSWLARLYVPTKNPPRRQEKLGHTDDHEAADGLGVLSYAQALDRVREWSRGERAKIAGVRQPGAFTVEEAMEEYMRDFERRGKRSQSQTQSAIKAHILPQLGAIKVDSLTRDDVRTWLYRLVEAPARRRSKRDAKRPAFKPSPKTEDEKRRRKDTANRVLSVLKAALNFAMANDRIMCNGSAWREVKPFHAVAAPRVRFLDSEQQRALIAAAEGDFKLLLIGALFTGARYGELARLEVGHFNGTSLYLPASITKTRKARRVLLNAEAQTFFSHLCEGRAVADLIFTHDGGKPFEKSEQHRRMRAVSAAAGIVPAVIFYALRHTAAANWLRAGVHMKFLAEQLGNSVSICDKYYAHLALDDRARVFASLPSLGLDRKKPGAKRVGRKEARAAAALVN